MKVHTGMKLQKLARAPCCHKGRMATVLPAMQARLARASAGDHQLTGCCLLLIVSDTSCCIL